MRSWLVGINRDFISSSKLVLITSSIFSILTMFWLVFSGMNYGVDFSGGYMLILKPLAGLNLTLETITSVLSQANAANITAQVLGQDEWLVKFTSLSKIDVSQLFLNIAQCLRFDSVGPKFAQELFRQSSIAGVCAFFAMWFYVWQRFGKSYAYASTIALLHDCIAILAMYSFFKIEFDVAAIVGLLITTCYSINDTIIVFDRIRWEVGNHPERLTARLVNTSINKTLSRTILTSFTTLLSLLALYIFGKDIIRSYSLPIMVGVVVGTYSSIFIAASTLLIFNKKPLALKSS